MTYPDLEGNFNQPGLERALRNALKSVLEKDGRPDPRTGFYHKFKEEIAEHDDYLQKKQDEYLNTTLIFSGLFSAVTSAFIIDFQSELKPDYEGMNNALLELLLNVTIGNIPPGQPVTVPRWTGPSPAIRKVQATLYATLCTTLLAAFLATLGKQWLNWYRQTDALGSVEDRCKDRERKLSWVGGWWFYTVIQSAPLIIQGSLGLLGAALSRYLWEVDRTVSSVVIGFTSFGCILYLATVVVSVLSPDCPFHTPISSLVRIIIDGPKRRQWDHPRRTAPDLTTLAKGGLIVDMTPLHGLNRRVRYSSSTLEEGYRSDARCITRALVLSTDVDTIRLTVDFAQELIWDVRIGSALLPQLYRKLLSCFDFTRPRAPILIPTMRDMAYHSAKAWTHIQVQLRCISQHRDLPHIGDDWLTNTPHTPLGVPVCIGDPDLQSTLFMVDKAFGCDVEMPWDQYRLSPSHHLWVSHLFVYIAWHDPLSEDASVFVKHSLDPDKSSGNAVITDCLYIVNTMLGTLFPIEDLTKRDKSRQMDSMLEKIFSELSRRFMGPLPTNVVAPEWTLRALKLITRLGTAAVATKSYELFKTIMQSQVAQEEKMEAARLALYVAYQPGLKSVPPVGDPKWILSFLHHHVDPRVAVEDQIHAVSSGMCAIDSASDDPTSQSWTWRIENAGELLTGFQQSPHPEGFKWWYKVLWIHYRGLDPSVRNRLDKIAVNRGDSVDLKQCRIAIEKEMERVKGLDAAACIVALEEAHCRLSALISHGEKSRGSVRSIIWPTDSPDIVVRDYRRRTAIPPMIR